MSEAQHRRVKEIFLAVADLAGEERAGFLDEACAGDPALRSQVEHMLAAEAKSPGFMDGSPAAATSPMARAEPARERATPDAIGHYRVVRRIGEGGMGVVYEAQQDTPRRRVAVKVISRGLASPSVLRRFQHEAEVLGRLQHPGIAQIFEAGSIDEGDGGQPFFAMEFIDGQPITTYARTSNLSNRQRLELVAQVADAVQHAHQRGVIHRDLKPANILVDQRGTPKILDFGVARLTDADIRTTTMRTNVGQLVGTIPYMSPEQAAGDPHELDTRSDVYALGVITYELLTGRLPYDVRDKMIHEAVRVIREQDPVPLSTVDRVLRGDVETIVATALDKERNRRYQSASALAEDIRRHLNDEPIAARPASAIYQLKKFAKRHRALVGAAALVALVLIGASIVSTSFAVRAGRDRDRALEAQASAEQRAGEVRELANTILFTVDEQIRNLSGSTAARETLVSTGLAYLDGLAAEARDDPELLMELARGYERIGDIQGNPRRSNLGDAQAALASYEKSRALWHEALEIAPDPLPARAGLAHLHKSFGEVYSDVGRTSDALAAYEAHLGMWQSIAAVRGDPEARSALSSAHAMLGNVSNAMGRKDAALEHYTRGLEVMRKLVDEMPESPRYRRSLGISLMEVGTVHEYSGDYARALEHYEQAMAIREKLAKEDPTNARYRRDLSLAYERAGRVCRQLDRHDDAIELLEKTRTMREALFEADPQNVRALFDLSVAHENLGNAHLDTHAYEAALAHFKTCEKLRRRWHEEHPETLMAQMALGGALERMGMARIALGRLDGAAWSLDESIELLTDAVAQDPDQYLVHSILASALSQLGGIQADRAAAEGLSDGDRLAVLSDALSLYQRSLRTAEGMEERGMHIKGDNVQPVSIRADVERCETALRELAVAADRIGGGAD